METEGSGSKYLGELGGTQRDLVDSSSVGTELGDIFQFLDR